MFKYARDVTVVRGEAFIHVSEHPEPGQTCIESNMLRVQTFTVSSSCSLAKEEELWVWRFSWLY